ncbi:MAG: hypothetical protein D6698_16970, partial [Gammaproteobacteria bacterium]
MIPIKKIYQRIISIVLIVAMQVQQNYPLLQIAAVAIQQADVISQELVSPAPVKAQTGAKCDGWADSGSTHNNNETCRKYYCDNGNWVDVGPADSDVCSSGEPQPTSPPVGNGSGETVEECTLRMTTCGAAGQGTCSECGGNCDPGFVKSGESCVPAGPPATAAPTAPAPSTSANAGTGGSSQAGSGNICYGAWNCAGNEYCAGAGSYPDNPGVCVLGENRDRSGDEILSDYAANGGDLNNVIDRLDDFAGSSGSVTNEGLAAVGLAPASGGSESVGSVSEGGFNWCFEYDPQSCSIWCNYCGGFGADPTSPLGCQEQAKRLCGVQLANGTWAFDDQADIGSVCRNADGSLCADNNFYGTAYVNEDGSRAVSQNADGSFNFADGTTGQVVDVSVATNGTFQGAGTDTPDQILVSEVAVAEEQEAFLASQGLANSNVATNTEYFLEHSETAQKVIETTQETKQLNEFLSRASENPGESVENIPGWEELSEEMKEKAKLIAEELPRTKKELLVAYQACQATRVQGISTGEGQVLGDISGAPETSSACDMYAAKLTTYQKTMRDAGLAAPTQEEVEDQFGALLAEQERGERIVGAVVDVYNLCQQQGQFSPYCSVYEGMREQYKDSKLNLQIDLQIREIEAVRVAYEEYQKCSVKPTSGYDFGTCPAFASAYQSLSEGSQEQMTRFMLESRNIRMAESLVAQCIANPGSALCRLGEQDFSGIAGGEGAYTRYARDAAVQAYQACVNSVNSVNWDQYDLPECADYNQLKQSLSGSDLVYVEQRVAEIDSNVRVMQAAEACLENVYSAICEIRRGRLNEELGETAKYAEAVRNLRAIEFMTSEYARCLESGGGLEGCANQAGAGRNLLAADYQVELDQRFKLIAEQYGQLIQNAAESLFGNQENAKFDKWGFGGGDVLVDSVGQLEEFTQLKDKVASLESVTVDVCHGWDGIAAHALDSCVGGGEVIGQTQVSPRYVYVDELNRFAEYLERLYGRDYAAEYRKFVFNPDREDRGLTLADFSDYQNDVYMELVSGTLAYLGIDENSEVIRKISSREILPSKVAADFDDLVDFSWREVWDGRKSNGGEGVWNTFVDELSVSSVLKFNNWTHGATKRGNERLLAGKTALQEAGCLPVVGVFRSECRQAALQVGTGALEQGAAPAAAAVGTVGLVVGAPMMAAATTVGGAVTVGFTGLGVVGTTHSLQELGGQCGEELVSWNCGKAAANTAFQLAATMTGAWVADLSVAGQAVNAARGVDLVTDTAAVVENSMQAARVARTIDVANKALSGATAAYFGAQAYDTCVNGIDGQVNGLQCGVQMGMAAVAGARALTAFLPSVMSPARVAGVMSRLHTFTNAADFGLNGLNVYLACQEGGDSLSCAQAWGNLVLIGANTTAEIAQHAATLETAGQGEEVLPLEQARAELARLYDWSNPENPQLLPQTNSETLAAAERAVRLAAQQQAQINLLVEEALKAPVGEETGAVVELRQAQEAYRQALAEYEALSPWEGRRAIDYNELVEMPQYQALNEARNRLFTAQATYRMEQVVLNAGSAVEGVSDYLAMAKQGDATSPEYIRYLNEMMIKVIESEGGYNRTQRELVEGAVSLLREQVRIGEELIGLGDEGNLTPEQLARKQVLLGELENNQRVYEGVRKQIEQAGGVGTMIREVVLGTPSEPTRLAQAWEGSGAKDLVNWLRTGERSSEGVIKTGEVGGVEYELSAKGRSRQELLIKKAEVDDPQIIEVARAAEAQIGDRIVVEMSNGQTETRILVVGEDGNLTTRPARWTDSLPGAALVTRLMANEGASLEVEGRITDLGDIKVLSDDGQPGMLGSEELVGELAGNEVEIVNGEGEVVGRLAMSDSVKNISGELKNGLLGQESGEYGVRIAGTEGVGVRFEYRAPTVEDVGSFDGGLVVRMGEKQLALGSEYSLDNPDLLLDLGEGAVITEVDGGRQRTFAVNVDESGGVVLKQILTDPYRRADGSRMGRLQVWVDRFRQAIDPVEYQQLVIGEAAKGIMETRSLTDGFEVANVDGRPRVVLTDPEGATPVQVRAAEWVNNELFVKLAKAAGFEDLRFNQARDFGKAIADVESLNRQGPMADYNGILLNLATGGGKSTIVAPLMNKLAIALGGVAVQMYPGNLSAGNIDHALRIGEFYETELIVYRDIGEEETAFYRLNKDSAELLQRNSNSLTVEQIASLNRFRLEGSEVKALVEAAGSKVGGVYQKGPVILTEGNSFGQALNLVREFELIGGSAMNPWSAEVAEAWITIRESEFKMGSLDEIGEFAAQWSRSFGEQVEIAKLGEEATALGGLKSGEEAVRVFRETDEFALVKDAREGKLEIPRDASGKRLGPMSQELAARMADEVLRTVLKRGGLDENTMVYKRLAELSESYGKLSTEAEYKAFVDEFEAFARMPDREIPYTDPAEVAAVKRFSALADTYRNSVEARLEVLTKVAGNDIVFDAETGQVVNAELEDPNGLLPPNIYQRMALQDEGALLLSKLNGPKGIDEGQLTAARGAVGELKVSPRSFITDMQDVMSFFDWFVAMDATDGIASARLGLKPVNESVKLHAPKVTRLAVNESGLRELMVGDVWAKFERGEQAFVVDTGESSWQLSESMEDLARRVGARLEEGEMALVAEMGKDGFRLRAVDRSGNLSELSGEIVVTDPAGNEVRVNLGSISNEGELYAAARGYADQYGEVAGILAYSKALTRGLNYKWASAAATDISEIMVMGDTKHVLADITRQAAGRLRGVEVPPYSMYALTDAETLARLSGLSEAARNAEMLKIIQANQARFESELAFQRGQAVLRNQQKAILYELGRIGGQVEGYNELFEKYSGQISDADISRYISREADAIEVYYNDYLESMGRISRMLAEAKELGISSGRINELARTYGLGGEVAELATFRRAAGRQVLGRVLEGQEGLTVEGVARQAGELGLVDKYGLVEADFELVAEGRSAVEGDTTLTGRAVAFLETALIPEVSTRGMVGEPTYLVAESTASELVAEANFSEAVRGLELDQVTAEDAARVVGGALAEALAPQVNNLALAMSVVSRGVGALVG